MLKKFKILCLLASSMLVFSGCTPKESALKSSSYQTQTAEHTKTDTSNKISGNEMEGDAPQKEKEVLYTAVDDKGNKEPNSPKFREGVFINFDNYKKSFFNDDIIGKLSSNLDAIVKDNKIQFEKYLSEEFKKDPNHLAYFFGNGNKYMFDNLDTIEKDENSEVIRVGIVFRIKSKNKVVNSGITYHFTKNSSGTWLIRNID
ncbi:hypothetical protein ACYCS5_15865 [Paenibacillus sp. SEL3]